MFAFEVAWNISTTKGMKPSRRTVASGVLAYIVGLPAPEDLGDDHAQAPTRTLFCPSRRTRSSSLLTSNASDWQNSHDARDRLHQARLSFSKSVVSVWSGPDQNDRSEWNRPRYQDLEPTLQHPSFGKKWQSETLERSLLARVRNRKVCQQVKPCTSGSVEKRVIQQM